jgi:hypothetical protein
MILLIAVSGIPKFLPDHQRDPVSALDLLCVIVSLVAATGWSQDLILPTRSVTDGIVFKPWKDFFVHATIVTRSVGDQTLLQVGNFEWKGFPAVIYNYASFSLASCLAKVGHLPAYDTVVEFWAPFGSLLTGLAGYAVGRAIWGPQSGIGGARGYIFNTGRRYVKCRAPLLRLFLAPTHCSWRSLWCCDRRNSADSCNRRDARRAARLDCNGCGSRRLGSSFQGSHLRGSISATFSFAILAWPPRKRRQWLVLAVCVAAGVALLTLANHFHVGPDVYFDFSGSDWYWKGLAKIASGTRVENWYQVFSTGHPFPSHLAQAIGLLLLNALGVFAIVAPLVWLLAARRKTWQASDTISVAAVAILLLMTFGLSGNAMLGNEDELIHRPFVWAYWLVGSLTAGRLFSMAAGSRLQQPTWAVAVGIFALMLVPVWYGSGLQRGKWSGADSRSNLRVDRGLIDCAYYIRGQPPSNTVAQDSRLDRLLILGGLSERRSFAARLEVWTRAGNVFRESSYQKQLRKLKSLQEATNIPDLQRSVRRTGIRWYVVHPGDSYAWPTEFRDRPVVESNGYKVYDMQRCFDLRG